MEWYYILLILIVSIILLAFCICGITAECIFVPYITNIATNTWGKQCENVGLSKVNTITTICKIDRAEVGTAHRIYYDYTKSNQLSIYEYKIENTIYPRVIENIIKEYIGFRLLYCYNGRNFFYTEYPHKFICRICSNCKCLNNQANNNLLIFMGKRDNILTEPYTEIYNIKPEGGFEMFPTNKLLEVKIE